MQADLSIKSKKTVGKRIAANAGLMVGAKFLSAILGFGSVFIATRALDPVLFGTVVFLHAYMLFFSEVATFQSWQSIIRFGTDDLAKKDTQSLSKLIKFGVKIDALSSILAYIGSIALFGLVILIVNAYPNIAPKNGLSVEDLRNYSAVYCLLVLARQISTSIGVLRLFDRFEVLAGIALVMPVTRFIGTCYAAYAGWGVQGFLAVWFGASLLSYFAKMVIAMAELSRRNLLRSVIKAKSSLRKQRAGLWPFVIKSNIDSTIATGNLHLPPLMVMALFGPAFTGVYKIAEEVAKLLSEGFKLLDQVIYPELAKLMTSGQADKIWRIVMRSAVILLSIGLVLSVVVSLFGEQLLTPAFGVAYIEAAPLASLLVFAAALTGIFAPLFPIFYAADKPEVAIYARGVGLLIYIVSFIGLSFSVGKMAPGWAALIGNGVCAVCVFILARRTLRNHISSQNVDAQDVANVSSNAETALPIVHLAGVTQKRIWGLPLLKWQGRAYQKAGGRVSQDEPPNVIADSKWVLSAALANAFVKARKTALCVDGIIVGVTDMPLNDGLSLLGRSASDATAAGLTAAKPEDLAGSYNKVLRKMEAPYALNAEEVAISDIMRRQFASSYKGITDFVTKYFWPLPAFYVTRLCAALRLTPNMVTTIGLVLMFAAMYYFYHGQWALGFITGWMMTFLDTVDGKLARTTMTYSWWGNIYDHGIDLVHPPFWYWAWYVGLGGTFSWAAVTTDWMTIALMAIFVGYVVDRIIEGVFIAQHGFHIHVWRPVNSFLRIYTARRNPNMFIFMVGIILSLFIPQAAVGAFYAVAIWTWACIAFNIGVVLVGTFMRKPITSWMDE
ncbi:MAG: CDP-alcohol phosphatidyltransferase family protein [Maricaulaceae bacterium]